MAGGYTFAAFARSNASAMMLSASARTLSGASGSAVSEGVMSSASNGDTVPSPAGESPPATRSGERRIMSDHVIMTLEEGRVGEGRVVDGVIAPLRVSRIFVVSEDAAAAAAAAARVRVTLPYVLLTGFGFGAGAGTGAGTGAGAGAAGLRPRFEAPFFVGIVVGLGLLAVGCGKRRLGRS